MAGRSSEEIRSSIEANRTELALSLARLRGEVVELADWRGQIGRHRREVLVGATIAGFVVGGGMAALGGLLSRRRRRR
jgi:hypothetical protein